MSAKDRRFWINNLSESQDKIILEGPEARHAQTVLRCQVNDPVSLLDGQGHYAAGKIIHIEKKRLEIQIESFEYQPPPIYQFVLVQSWLKGKSMDWTLQKATEIGATDIVPIWTQNSEIRLKPKDVSSKLEKWQTAIREACKQCGRLHAPVLHPPLSFQEAVKHWSGPEHSLKPLVAALTDQTQSIHQALLAHQSLPPQHGASIWIGPEGDFTQTEYQTLFETGAIPVRLGPHILRSETAALAGITLMIDAFLSWGSVKES